MKRNYSILLLTIISFVFLSLCYYSCASLNNIEIPQDPIIGKWGLVKTVSGRTAQGTITQIYSAVDVLIFEFKPGNILTVQCLRQDNACIPYQNGNYSYLLINRDNDTMIRIDNTSWWYSISDKELMISKAPVDGGSYFFERM